MHIIFFTHPSFLGSQSMPRFAAMLANGMQVRGHHVDIWTPEAFFYKLPVPRGLKKWLGYADQYLLFPHQVKKRLQAYSPDTLFVFTDHALGPWVPLVAHRPHVIHCHDFLAQRSALGHIPENPTSKTGKKYQQYIRNGYGQGRNFISVSNKTRQDLHQLLGRVPAYSKMVYNGLNQHFEPANTLKARANVSAQTGLDVQNGYLLHVGGNQWYKNRTGVIQIYNAWRSVSSHKLPLLLVGLTPNGKIMLEYNNSPYQKDIYVITGKSDEFIRQVYSGATLFLFPSLAEGFGWPIAEAMASGCPVVTTNEAPMTEVGGSAAFYVPAKRFGTNEQQWAAGAANVVEQVVNLSVAERNQVINNGLANASRFDPGKALQQIESIYKQILNIELTTTG